MTRPALPAVILAGGASSRMGRDKAALRLGSETLLDHAIARLAGIADPIVVSRHADDRLALPEGVDLVTDPGPDFDGPLAGIAAALQHFRGSSATHMLSVAVDTPFFPASLGERLSAGMTDGGNIAYATCAGRAHPVFALWPIALADALSARLQRGASRKMMDFIQAYPNVAVPFDPVETPFGAIDPFFNINTPADYQRAQELAPRFR